MLYKKLLIIFISLMLSLSFLVTTVIAQNNNNQQVAREEINPDAGTRYLIKRLKEKITLFFKFGPEAKVNYYQTLLDKRLAELVHISDNKNTAYIENTSSRYESTAGQLTQSLLTLNRKEKFQEARAKFENHLTILSKIQTNFSPTTAEWRFVENAINSLKIYSQQISNL